MGTYTISHLQEPLNQRLASKDTRLLYKYKYITVTYTKAPPTPECVDFINKTTNKRQISNCPLFRGQNTQPHMPFVRIFF